MNIDLPHMIVSAVLILAVVLATHRSAMYKNASRGKRTAVILTLVFTGGALGSLGRELLSPVLPAPWIWFPTLLINVAACFAIGLLYSLRNRLPAHLMHLAAVGFCGGFSTFSHLTAETILLGGSRAFAEAVIYPILSVCLGVAEAVAGEGAGQRLHAGQDF